MNNEEQVVEQNEDTAETSPVNGPKIFKTYEEALIKQQDGVISSINIMLALGIKEIKIESSLLSSVPLESRIGFQNFNVGREDEYCVITL